MIQGTFFNNVNLNEDHKADFLLLHFGFWTFFKYRLPNLSLFQSVIDMPALVCKLGGLHQEELCSIVKLSGLDHKEFFSTTPH